MTFNITKCIAAAIVGAAIFAASCKKKESSSPENVAASNILVEGRGLKKVHVVTHPSAGNFCGFQTASMGLAADGNTLDWVFAWYSSVNSANSYQTYRRRLNILSGDTMANPGLPAARPANYAGNTDYYFHVPGSNEIYWPTATTAEGEPAALPFPYYVGIKVYNNGQVMSYNHTSGFSGDRKPVSATYLRNGNIIDTNYLLFSLPGPGMIRCMDMELTTTGIPIMLVTTGDSIQVRRFSDNVLLAGIPCSSLSRDYTSTILPLCDMYTKRSADGTFITGWIKDVTNIAGARVTRNTTFIYNTVTNSIDIKVNNIIAGPSSPLQITCDEDGNIYYVEEPTFIAGQAYGGIMKQTPAGTTVLADRFMKESSNNIQYIKAMGKKLFVVLHQGENSNAPAGSRVSTYVLTVAE